RRRGLGVGLAPQAPCRIKYGVAPNQEVGIRALAQAGRLAERDREGVVDLVGRGVYAHDAAARRVRPELRDRQIEPAGGGVPLRLFGAVCRVDAIGGVQEDPVRSRDPRSRRGWLSERASRSVDLDERSEGWIVGVVDRQDHAVIWIVRQL